MKAESKNSSRKCHREKRVENGDTERQERVGPNAKYS